MIILIFGIFYIVEIFFLDIQIFLSQVLWTSESGAFLGVFFVWELCLLNYINITIFYLWFEIFTSISLHFHCLNKVCTTTKRMNESKV